MSPNDLTSIIGNPDELALRRSLCRLTDDDVDALRVMGFRLAGEIPEIVDDFYSHLNRFEFLRTIVEKHTTIQRLKMAFEGYCRELLSGNYDQDYFAKRSRVGMTHERVGLPINWYIGMLAYLQQVLIARVKKTYQSSESDLLWKACEALQRLILMDQLIIVEAYIAASTQKLRDEATKATEAKKAKSMFLASISHELRTPMNAILGFSELVLSKSAEISPTTRKHLDAVRRNAENLLQLINNLLDLSKSESGKMDLRLTTASISELLDDMALNLQTLVAGKPIKIVQEYDGEALGHQALDFGKLRQVILNLISNAARFTASGTITIFAVRRLSELEVVIRDTGTGISDADQQRLFTEFYQVKSASQGGTGLGLVLCRNLLTVMGGTISLASKIGAGSAVTIVVPFNKDRRKY
jgi:signal transduction histidine kinase